MKSPFYIGSYSIPSPWTGTAHARGVGIVCAELDAASGAVSLRSMTQETNPSFLVRDAEARLLWAITEPEFGGELIAYRVESSGALTPLGRMLTGADAPCHLAIDQTRRLAFVSHYHGGSVAMLSLGESGEPLERLAVVAPPERIRGEDRGAARPRPHAAMRLGADQLIVADAGRDWVLLYRLVGEGPAWGLELLDARALALGTGPRHLARHGATEAIYVSNQNAGGVTILGRAQTGGAPRLELRAVVSSEGLGREKCIPSEIAVHPTFDVAYLANRGDNSLSIFAIACSTGELTPCGSIDVRGRNPRHFAISPSGDYLIVANQDSNNLTVFRVKRGGRELEWTGQAVDVATPTAICF
jgi:6-phosphogluconolactonase